MDHICQAFLGACFHAQGGLIPPRGHEENYDLLGIFSAIEFEFSLAAAIRTTPRLHVRH